MFWLFRYRKLLFRVSKAVDDARRQSHIVLALNRIRGITIRRALIITLDPDRDWSEKGSFDSSANCERRTSYPPCKVRRSAHGDCAVDAAGATQAFNEDIGVPEHERIEHRTGEEVHDAGAVSGAEYIAGASVGGIHRQCPARAELDLTATVHPGEPYTLGWHGQAEIHKAETGLKSGTCSPGSCAGVHTREREDYSISS